MLLAAAAYVLPLCVDLLVLCVDVLVLWWRGEGLASAQLPVLAALGVALVVRHALASSARWPTSPAGSARPPRTGWSVRVDRELVQGLVDEERTRALVGSVLAMDASCTCTRSPGASRRSTSCVSCGHSGATTARASWSTVPSSPRRTARWSSPTTLIRSSPTSGPHGAQAQQR